jgi:hypothetical protein
LVQVLLTPAALLHRYGAYRGYCALGVLCQNLENPHLRAALKMQPQMTGVLINTIQSTTATAQASRKCPMLPWRAIGMLLPPALANRQHLHPCFDMLWTLACSSQSAA